MVAPLNPQSPMPLYHQLAEILLARVRSGEYLPGSRIPSEHSLAVACGIGRPTARQAIELLVRKRILERRRGSGTYVRIKEQEIDLFSLAGTMASFQNRGIPVTTQILRQPQLVSVDPDLENPFSGQKAYFLSRLSRVEEMPVLVEDIYLHGELFAGIDRIDLAGQSLARIADERYHLRPTSGKQNFRIGYLDGEHAHHLAVLPNVPVLVVKRFLHFPQAENSIYAELYCRTDQFVFAQTIGGVSDD
jgi:GntR family transcriptional regulator